MEATSTQVAAASLSKSYTQSASIANRKYDPIVGSDHDSVSSVSADSGTDSGSNSNSSSDDEGEPHRKRMPKICLLVRQILDQIRSLYDLSSLLRRPKIADKYIRSDSTKSDQPTTLPLTVSFNKSDERHIVEKMLQWRGLTKSGKSISFEDEDAASVGQGLVTEDVDDISWYCQRLTRANMRRREQLQYWRDHPYDEKPNTTENAPKLMKHHVTGSEAKEGSQSQTSTLEGFKLPNAGPKSAMSKQSFSTVAFSDVYDTKTNVRPRTVYAPTNIGQDHSNSVPEPPKTKNGENTFTCPYCGMTLEFIEMQNRQSWKRHVFHDLRPYVCTFEDCQNSDKLYISRHEWANHELQMHRRNYVCKECPKTCSKRTEMSAHLQEHYGQTISPAQLSVILDLCDHQVDDLVLKDNCLICGKEERSYSAFQRHLATHMEDIALFVLPNADQEDETGGTNDSVRAARRKSKGKASDAESEYSSLGFSAAGDHGQSPADFSKLFTSEEAGYAFKFSHWDLTEMTEDAEIAAMKEMVKMLDDSDEEAKDFAIRTLGSIPALPYEIIEAMSTKLEYRDRSGRTVLSWAAAYGCEVTIQRLVEKGANIESRDTLGLTPLHIAAANDRDGAVKELMRNGADFESRNDYGATPLHSAALNSSHIVTRRLIDGGANFESRDKSGMTPLHSAAHSSNHIVIRWLIDEGANVESRDGDGRTPLHTAVRFGNEINTRQLLARGAVIGSTDNDGMTPLHFAAERGDPVICSMLIQVGADTQTEDSHGCTPLSLATENGHQAIAHLLRPDMDSSETDPSSEVRPSTIDNTQTVWAGNYPNTHVKDPDPQYNKKLDSTMTDVYSDELYTPHFNITTSSSSQPPIAVSSNDDLSPQRLQVANSQQTSQGHQPEMPRPISPRDAILEFTDPDEGHFSLFAPHDVAVEDIDHELRDQHQINDESARNPDPSSHTNFKFSTSRNVDIKPVHLLKHTSSVSCVSFSRDGKFLATGCSHTAQVFDVQTGDMVYVLSHRPDGYIHVRSVCFSPDGRYLATAGDDHIYIWDIESRTVLNQLGGHTADIEAIDFSPDGKWIVSGGGDQTLRLWHVETGILTFTYKTVHLITSAVFSPDGGFIAAGSFGKVLRVWTVHDGLLSGPFEISDAHTSVIHSIAFSPSSKDLVSGSLDNTIKTWSLNVSGEGLSLPVDAKCTGTMDCLKAALSIGAVLSIAWTPDAKWLLSGSRDTKVRLWDPQTCQTKATFEFHYGWVNSVAVAPQGGIFASGSTDSNAWICSYSLSPISST